VFDKLVVLFAANGLVLWGPFLLLVICGLGLPVPEDIVLVSAGYLAYQHSHHFFTVAAVMYVGILVGDSVVYFMGRYVGRRAIAMAPFRYWINAERISRSQKLFKKYGIVVIFVGRFLPGLRAPIFFSSGILHFSFPRFFVIDALAAFVSAPLFVWIGYWAAKNGAIDYIKSKIGETQAYLLISVVFVALLVIYVMKYRIKNRKNPGG
jgi:membrane protein DedA with SNARE-associated domain